MVAANVFDAPGETIVVPVRPASMTNNEKLPIQLIGTDSDGGQVSGEGEMLSL